MAFFDGEITRDHISESKALRARAFVMISGIDDRNFLWSCYNEEEIVELRRCQKAMQRKWSVFRGEHSVVIDLIDNKDEQFIFTFAKKVAKFRPESYWWVERQWESTLYLRFVSPNDAMLFIMTCQ